MNELLNIVNLPAMGIEPPPVATPVEEGAGGDKTFAALLSQLGMAGSVPSMPEMMKKLTEQTETGSSIQIDPALLQLLSSVGLTGQPQAMDGSFTGLPAAASAPNVPQEVTLMSLPAGAAPIETLTSLKSLLESALPARSNAQPVALAAELMPPEDGTSLAKVLSQIPAEIMLSNGDLAKLKSILAADTFGTVDSELTQPAQLVKQDGSLPHAPTEVAEDLTSLEKTLREQFPTLNIKNLAAQLHLESPELATRSTQTVLESPETMPMPERMQLSLPVKDTAVSATLQTGLPVDATVNVLGSRDIAQQVVESANIVASNPAVQSTVAAIPAIAQETVDARTGVNASGRSDGSRAVLVSELGNLEKTAIKATEGSSEYLQSAEQWAKQTNVKSDVTAGNTGADVRQPDLEKPTFRIQFDRFQIDALLKRSEIKLQLQPASLGSMRVRLISTSQEVTARFETTNEAARTAVEQNLPQLRESLDKAGIKVDHVEVVLDDQRSRQQQSHNQSQKRQQAENSQSEFTGSPSGSQTAGGIGSLIGSMQSGLNLLA